MIFASFIIFQASKLYPVWLAIILTGISGFIHFRRRDYGFLTTQTQNPLAIFFAEYTLISLPVAISLLFNGQWIITLGLLLFTFFLSGLPGGKTQIQLDLQLGNIIPARAFEWKSGVRKAQLWIIILYIIGLALSFTPAGAPGGIFLLSLIMLNFYEHGEPLSILLAEELPSQKFIFRKINIALKLYLLGMLPLLAAHLIFNAELWFVPFLITILAGIIMVYAIVLKYAFYEPGTRNHAAQLFLSLGIISIFIPVLLPLILVLIVYFYNRAIKNLNNYLNDFN